MEGGGTAVEAGQGAGRPVCYPVRSDWPPCVADHGGAQEAAVQIEGFGTQESAPHFHEVDQVIRLDALGTALNMSADDVRAYIIEQLRGAEAGPTHGGYATGAAGRPADQSPQSPRGPGSPDL